MGNLFSIIIFFFKNQFLKIHIPLSVFPSRIFLPKLFFAQPIVVLAALGVSARVAAAVSKAQTAAATTQQVFGPTVCPDTIIKEYSAWKTVQTFCDNKPKPTGCPSDIKSISIPTPNNECKITETSGSPKEILRTIREKNTNLRDDIDEALGDLGVTDKKGAKCDKLQTQYEALIKEHNLDTKTKNKQYLEESKSKQKEIKEQAQSCQKDITKLAEQTSKSALEYSNSLNESNNAILANFTKFQQSITDAQNSALPNMKVELETALAAQVSLLDQMEAARASIDGKYPTPGCDSIYKQALANASATTKGSSTNTGSMAKKGASAAKIKKDAAIQCNTQYKNERRLAELQAKNEGIKIQNTIDKLRLQIANLEQTILNAPAEMERMKKQAEEELKNQKNTAQSQQQSELQSIQAQVNACKETEKQLEEELQTLQSSYELGDSNFLNGMSDYNMLENGDSLSTSALDLLGAKGQEAIDANCPFAVDSKSKSKPKVYGTEAVKNIKEQTN